MGQFRQENGWIGHQVGNMVRRTVRSRFRAVYWDHPGPIEEPTILAINHHGWHDGYIVFHALTALNLRAYDWITEFDAFPLFKHIQGLPYPRDDAAKRAGSIRTVIRGLKAKTHSFMIFPEAEMHPGPQVNPLGKAVDLVWRQSGKPAIRPCAIAYTMGMHERPEAYVRIGDPLALEVMESGGLHHAMERELTSLRDAISQPDKEWAMLAKGTGDVNERWDFRTRFGRKQP
jgi:1-acyl-sn-glycerol-3-phosphate acyltransferase